MQIEHFERQKNMILEIVGNHDSSRDTWKATFQTLEGEEKTKPATLGVTIDTKVSSSVRKFIARPHFK